MSPPSLSTWAETSGVWPSKKFGRPSHGGRVNVFVGENCVNVSVCVSVILSVSSLVAVMVADVSKVPMDSVVVSVFVVVSVMVTIADIDRVKR